MRIQHITVWETCLKQKVGRQQTQKGCAVRMWCGFGEQQWGWERIGQGDLEMKPVRYHWQTCRDWNDYNAFAGSFMLAFSVLVRGISRRLLNLAKLHL